jgi:dsDNA-specific endonuclease/ATPase MutS2
MDWDNFKKTVKAIKREDKETTVYKVPVVIRQTVDTFIRKDRLIVYLQHDVQYAFIERKIDLHGLTLDQAFQKLKIFIDSSKNITWVLVITGKGNPNSNHTIKKMLPLWLEDLPVKGYSVAPKSLGGDGAIIVKLLG